MDLRQFRESLVQVLQNYRRCGVTRFVRQEAEQLPDELLKRLASLAQAAAPVAAPMLAAPVTSTPGTNHLPAANREAAGSRSPAAAELASERPTETQPAGVPPLAESSTPVAAPGPPWSLPVLDVEARRQRFVDLEQQVRGCRQCSDIVGYRHQTVFGVGKLNPTVCFMGEAPGADEDRLGEPFVGKAGQLLTKIIGAMKLRREEVYILNALKCRPPQNRTPVPEEIENCRHFVETQLDVLQPKFIVCLGAVAVRSILQSTLSIGRLRGQLHQYRGAKVVVTYHPSYLLRNEGAKRLVWEDMQMLMREME